MFFWRLLCGVIDGDFATGLVLAMIVSLCSYHVSWVASGIVGDLRVRARAGGVVGYRHDLHQTVILVETNQHMVS